jgi:predicted RNA-binding protein with PIN domain
VGMRREAFEKQGVGGWELGRSRSAGVGWIGRWGRFGREMVVAIGIGVGFVAVGVGWAAVESEFRDRDEGCGAIVYAASPMTCREPTIWLVDGYNVLHAAVLGGKDRSQWWTGSRRRELLERVSGFDTDADADAEVWIVFDGPDDSGATSGSSGPHCVFADSADDWLVDRVRRAEDPAEIAVVTADRQVADRARGRGARVVSPKDFLARCATLQVNPEDPTTRRC